MKFLITGGCGFLGSNLASEVLRRGDELTILDNLSRFGSDQNRTWLQSLGDFKFVHGDTSDSTAVDNVMREGSPDVVFHLAGQVAMTTSIENPRLDFNTNVLGGFNVLEAVRKFSPHATVTYSSTNKVYGDLEWIDYAETDTRYRAIGYDSGFDERLPLGFRSPYGCSKGTVDQYMLDYARVFGLNTVVFRHSSMYGGRQFATCDQGWIGWFCQQATQQKLTPDSVPFTISGNGKQVRDVLHADDMVRLYFSVVPAIDRVKGHVFNIGGGMANSLSLLELFDWLERYTGISLRYTQLPPRESDQKIFVADVSKARDLLNWTPGTPIDEGLSKMMIWAGR